GPAVGAVRDALVGAVEGAVLGAAQWFILQRKFEGSGWWIPASALGFAVGGAVSPTVRVAVDESIVRGRAPGRDRGCGRGCIRCRAMVHSATKIRGLWLVDTSKRWAGQWAGKWPRPFSGSRAGT